MNRPIDAERAWAAVLARDRTVEGRFVYAVRTTGVYCRPGCASRRPARQNVEFFASHAEAARAGYRACRRCRPDDPQPSRSRRAVERARAHLDAHTHETVTLAALGAVAGMSAFHLQRTFKQLLGCTPKQYQQARRAEHLRRRLKQGATVIQAGFEAGYGSGSRIYHQANAALGMTPATYRKGGVGTSIRYTTVSCPVGRVLIAATAKGVCAVLLGDDDAELVASLQREYPRGTLERMDGEFREWVGRITAYLSGEEWAASVPMDLDATAFQMRVWRALQEIPYGATRSYGEIAARIGAPRASRAVARACATNRMAGVIPCHRVVREDGRLGGYRWGIERKRRLLEQEQRG